MLKLTAALLLLILLHSCGGRKVSSSPERALVDELLSTIDSADYYRGLKESALEDQKLQLAATDSTSSEWLSLCISIANGYSNYIADSAFVYYNKALSRAGSKKDDLYYDELYYDALSGKEHTLNKIGYFVEAGMITDSVKLSDFPESKRYLYYTMLADYYHSLYNSLPRSSEYRQLFTDKYKAYIDTLLTLVPADSELALVQQEKRAGRAGRFEEALRINDLLIEKARNGRIESLAYSIYRRHVIYRYYMGRPVSDHVEYLLESAILDIKSGNQNMASLRYVESYLISIGDIASGKKVSDYYYTTMIRFGSRTRLLDALDISMRVNNEYSRMLRRQQLYTRAGLVGSIILLIFILLVLHQVISSSHRIQELNKKLERSSKTSLSYVLSFFNLYSSYISRILSLRSKINVSIHKGNYDYVLQLTDPSKDITGEELKSMYAYFDSAFLDIYPDYVEQFNSMLRPECRIVPKTDEKLTTELRIFAIIKLGITDSAKIAELLHCSIKTIYNKRSEINTKLAVDKEIFAKKLLEI